MRRALNRVRHASGPTARAPQVDTPHDEATTYITMTQQIIGFQTDLSAVFYTQLTDLEEECDGACGARLCCCHCAGIGAHKSVRCIL